MTTSPEDSKFKISIPSLEEAQKIIPRMNSALFSPELSLRGHDLSIEDTLNMLDQKGGWRATGWILASDLGIEKEDRPFLVMFEKENGLKRWCHISEAGLEMNAFYIIGGKID